MSTSNQLNDELVMMKQRLGVISTISEKGNPEGAAVYFISDNELYLYFLTRVGSRKYENIKRDPRVAFVVFGEHPPKTFQMEGTASIIEEPEEQRNIFKKLFDLATSERVLPPIGQMMKSELAVMKIKPTWARIGDFTMNPEKEKFQEVNFE